MSSPPTLFRWGRGWAGMAAVVVVVVVVVVRVSRSWFFHWDGKRTSKSQRQSVVAAVVAAEGRAWLHSVPHLQ